MAKPARANTVPLFCSLCANGPKFSDISHLLTHIASRGHVLNEDKLRATSHTSPEARVQLDRYVNWYDTNQIQRLLDERQQLKESRPPRARKNGKMKSEKGEVKLAFIAINSTVDSTQLSTAEEYQMASLLQEQTPKQADAERESDAPPIAATNSKPKTPIRPFDYSRVADFDLPEGELKGNNWPGMGVFDSATAGIRKSRNQKKDDSSYAQIHASSKATQPKELVMSSNFGSMQSSDLYAESVDPQLQPKTKPRRVLGERDPNEKTQSKRQKKSHVEDMPRDPSSSPKPVTLLARKPTLAAETYRAPMFPMLPPGYYIMGPDHQPVTFQPYPVYASYGNGPVVVPDRENIEPNRLHPMFQPYLGYAAPIDHGYCDCDAYHGVGPTLTAAEQPAQNGYGPSGQVTEFQQQYTEPAQMEKSPLLLTSPVLEQEDDRDQD